MYSIFLFSENDKYDITEFVGNLSWSDSIDTLGITLSFSIIKSSNIKVGDKILIVNNHTNKELLRGIVVTLSQGKYIYDATVMDFAFYLNKSKLIVQFNKSSVTNNIKSLCLKFNIPIGNITNISTQINKIYKDKTVAEIINDMLGQATNELGLKYRLEMREGKLFIDQYSDLLVEGSIYLAKNIAKAMLKDTITSIDKTESIQDMFNSIQVSSSEESDSRIVANIKDDASISKFGLLQEVISVEGKNESQAMNIAKNKLNELNRVAEDISINCLGDDSIRAGRILELSEADYNMNGKYLIKSTNHSYSNNIHKLSMTLGVI